MRNHVATGERIYLRPAEQSDAEVLSRSWTEETEVEFYDDGRIPTSALAFAHELRPSPAGAVPRALMFAVCQRADDACIGTVTLRHIDLFNGTAETGSGLFDAAHRGKGIGTEAKHLLLRFAFETLGLHAISATVFAGNTRSAAALRKQGYRLAGRLTADVHRRGQFMDTLVFDLLRPDWEAARRLRS